MNEKFVDFMQDYRDKRLAVAVSGGVDSVVLLHWLAELNLDITALHVNHGLRDAADTETEYVREICKKLDVPCHVFYWTGEKPESGLESAARDARYKMMTDFCAENKIQYLLTAHQADDQIETFLMNLSRGSGVYGLATMRTVTHRDGVNIVRPLLNVSRGELEKYAHDNNIKYFSDEMNEDQRYTRVKIRKNRHLITSKIGITDERILLAIENLGRTRDALDDHINKRIESVMRKDYARFTDSFLFDEAPDIRLKLLGRIIQSVGGDVYQPRLNSLESALSRLHHDCKFTLGGCTIRRLNNDILIVKEGNRSSFRKQK